MTFKEALCSCWKEKIYLSVLLYLLFGALYFSTQRFCIFVPYTVEQSILDRLIPFSPSLTVVYLSIFIFVSPGPLLLSTRSKLGRYSVGAVLQIVIAAIAFFLWPTAIARPVPELKNVLYETLVGIDGTINCCPSLHAALTLYSAYWASYSLSNIMPQLWGHTIIWTWALAIIYSAMAIKQHVLLDIVGGIVLAIMALAVVTLPPRKVLAALEIKG